MNPLQHLVAASNAKQEVSLEEQVGSALSLALKELRSEMLTAAQREATRSVRADPRTEELKVVKQELEDIKKHYVSIIAALEQSNKEAEQEQQVNKRILEDLASVKKGTSDVQSVEKKLSVVSQRVSALDARIALIENK